MYSAACIGSALLLSLFVTTADAQQAPQVAVQETRRPYSLWWYVMALLLAVALAESLLASQYLGTRREEL